MRLILATRAISYNQYYRNTRNGNRVKTGSGLAYDETLKSLLEPYKEDLKEFAKQLDPSKNIVKLTIKIANPKFFIKDLSRISENAGDLDNVIKVLQDKIFSAMGFDDYICRKLEICDFPSDTFAIIVDLEVHSLPPFQSVLSLLKLDEPTSFDFAPLQADIEPLTAQDFL